MQSITEDLLNALQDFTSVLKKTEYLKDMPELECGEIAVTLDQRSKVAQRLHENQVCAEKLQPYSPTGALCGAISLNQELLQHLESNPTSTNCPSSSSSSTPPSPDSTVLLTSMQCVHCWCQQVAALQRR
ncbi:uncharacterized protein PAE49_005280 [Odontesthes bonariensis]